MKLKYYMRGLGIGLCLAAIILSFGRVNDKKENMTDKEIMQRAQELGMIMPDDQLHNVLNGLNASGSPSPTKSVAPTAVPTLTPTLTPTLAPTKAPTVTPKPTLPPKVKDVKVSFSIKAGMSSDSVAKILQNIGVVKSAEDFNRYMIDHGKASVIRVGDYSLSKKSSYEDIVKKITR